MTEMHVKESERLPVRPGDEALEKLSFEVIGAALQVHKILGPGFLESVYEAALQVEMRARGLRAESQARVPICYRGALVGEHVLDLLVEGKLVVELKAVEALGPVHTAQVLSYLRATGLPLALLINFNSILLKDGIRRIAN